MSSLLRNLKLVKGKHFLFLSLALIFAAASVGRMLPFAVKDLFTAFDESADFSSKLKFLGGLFVTEYLVKSLYAFCMNSFLREFIQLIRTDVFRNWLSSWENPRKEGNNFPLGEVLARIMSDTESIRELLTSGALTIVVDVVFIASCLWAFFELNFQMGAFISVSEIIFAVLLFIGSKFIRRAFFEVRTLIGTMSRVYTDLLKGTKDLFFYPEQSYTYDTTKDVSDRFLSKQLIANNYDATYYSFAESLFPILLLLVVLVFPQSGIKEVAVLGALIDLINRSLEPIKSFTGKIASIQRATVGVKRYQEFMQFHQNFPKRTYDKVKTEDLNSLSVNINKFGYYDKNRASVFELRDIKFSLKKGERMGIVGASGSGKSTLFKIMSGDLPKVEGDDIEINVQMGREGYSDWSSFVGLVSQDSHIFSKALSFNLSLGKEGPELERFWNEMKVKVPYLEKWGIRLKEEIHPELLSLGQKQLISALRSLFLEKPVVLYDEISSGMDPQLEEALRTITDLYSQNNIILTIAHRVETLVKNDKILVLENGKMIGIDSHQKLFEENQYYQKFINTLGGH